jgi:hypothetical protein
MFPTLSAGPRSPHRREVPTLVNETDDSPCTRITPKSDGVAPAEPQNERVSGARILIERSETGIAVWVVDDGQGFDPEHRLEGRHGLTGMQERVCVHDGTLSITSDPGAGTTISAWLPMGTR